GLAGSMSLGRGSWLGSPGFVSPGRLFFFSLEVGGWRLVWDHPGLTLAPSSSNESATAKKRYERVNLIVIRLPTTSARKEAHCRLPISIVDLRILGPAIGNWQSKIGSKEGLMRGR